MSVFDLSWHFLKGGPMPDWSSTDRGYDEDPQFQNEIDSPKERVDAPSLDSNHILRLTRPQLDELMQNIQNEIQRRETKRANKNVAVVNQHSPTMSNDPTSSEGAEWIKNNAWAFEGG
tara:strand:+ start:365 stop:718 length:354 start_codon:yes stop_codon:yes gene_type:complete